MIKILLNRGSQGFAAHHDLDLFRLKAFNAFLLVQVLFGLFYVLIHLHYCFTCGANDFSFKWQHYVSLLDAIVFSLAYLWINKINCAHCQHKIKSLLFFYAFGVNLLFGYCTGLDSDYILFYIPILICFYSILNNGSTIKYFSFLAFPLLLLALFVVPQKGGILKAPDHYFFPEVMLSMVACLFFIFREQQIISQYHHGLVQESQKNQSLKQNYIQLQQEVLRLAEENSPAFICRFSEVYYDFFSKIEAEISPSEQKLCAFIKLDFSSPQIAEISSLSLRTVQTKKYNLKQKLQLKNEQSLSHYIQNL